MKDAPQEGYGFNPRPILPPPMTRNTAQCVMAANQEWRDVIDAARGFDGRNVMNGTRLFLGLSRVIHELIDDVPLRERVIQYFEQELRADFPPAQGKML